MPNLNFETEKQAEIAANKNHFRLLLILRGLAVNLYAIFIIVAYYFLDVFMPVRLIMAELTILAFICAFGVMQFYRRDAFSKVEIFAWLVFDICFLTIILMQSGGPSNPFVAAFIIPLVLGSLIFDRKFAWLIFGVTMLGFGILEMSESPLWIHNGARHSSFFNIHTQGMMFSYFLVASLLVFFVNGVSRNLKARDAAILALKQEAQDKQQITRMGLMAAGTAHELGTPLATISVILNDWLELSPPRKRSLRDAELRTMIEQVERCKTSLSEILKISGSNRGEGAKLIAIDEFLNALLQKWQSLQNETIDLNPFLELIDAKFAADKSLEQAIFNILDNAIRASRKNNNNRINFTAKVKSEELSIFVEDFGDGFSNDALKQFKDHSQKAQNFGFGIGLLLSQNIIRDLGGRVEISNKDEKCGAIVSIKLPIHIIKNGNGNDKNGE